MKQLLQKVNKTNSSILKSVYISLVLVSSFLTHLALSTKPGPEPIYARFPEIIDEINRILWLNGYAAHRRRKPTHSEYFGTTMPILTAHLLETFPLLRSAYPNLSCKTIEHLFLPPTKANNASKDYRSVIKARPYMTNTDNHKKGEKYHYCHAQVKLLRELFAEDEETLSISYDNKNKISIGKPAINRLNRSKRWFLKGDAPRSNSHDFPVDFHIIPSAYLLLTKRKCKYMARSRTRYDHARE